MKNMMNKVKGLMPLLLVAVALVAFVGCASEEAGQKMDKTTAVPTPLDGKANFTDHVLPLFTTAGAFFEGSPSCNGCHNGVAGAHELDMGSYKGILAGADVESKPPGVDILGRADACVGKAVSADCTPNWGKSKMSARLRNTRMPPGWETLQGALYDEDAADRDSPEISAIDAWMDGGGIEADVATSATIAYGTKLTDIVTIDGAYVRATSAAGETAVTWTKTDHAADATLGDLFTTGGAFFKGSPACDACHNGVAGEHELDMGSYTGILAGADVESKPPGVDILGRPDTCVGKAVGGECNPVAGSSKIHKRLRNTRMPPGWEKNNAVYNEDAANRDSAQISLIMHWINAGAPDATDFEIPKE